MSGSDHIRHDPINGNGRMRIDRVISNDSYLAPEVHEKLYLSPENMVRGHLRKTFGNPTPIGLAGMLLANTPACVDLMGWGGAGAGDGNIAAGNASYMYFGGMLFLIAGIGEWILGNTFPSVLFLTFSGYWATLGGTLMPFYAAISSYTDGNGNLDPGGFYASFAHFHLCMGLLCFIYLICALRTNICLASILGLFVIAFPFFAASYFYAAAGNAARSATCRIVGGACGFAASCIGWYLFTSLMFEAVDFPISLPIGDLSTQFKGKTARTKDRAEKV